MNISVAIADKDRDYTDRLREVLQQYNDLSIYVYTNAENLEDAIVKKRFDVVLFDADLCDRRIAFTEAKLPICLYHDDCSNLGMYLDTAKISKYQRISNIYKEIVRLFADKAGISFGLDQSQNTKIIAVYSPLGGCGKTTIGLSIAAKAANLGKQALFLNAEQLSSTNQVNPFVEEGLTALLEAMEDRNVNFELKVKGLAKQGLQGMYYIEGFTKYVDYFAVKKEDMISFLETIKKLGAYNVIVVDLSSAMDNIVSATMEVADSIVIVDKPGEVEIQKMEYFADQSVVIDYGKKMYRVCNFAENNIGFSQKLEAPCVGFVHNYGNLPITNMVQVINTNNEVAVDGLF